MSVQKAVRSLTCLTAILLTACTSAPGDKGAEDEAPLDGKADAFRSPTEHGTLEFESAQGAEVTAEERYHAWTFTLSGDARISLDASSSDIDTVLYLYRRTSSDASWGSYVERNDDNGSSADSHIERELDEGEYRIIVKSYKSNIEGYFSVYATCAGPGCSGITMDRCAEDEPIADVPASRTYTRECGARLVEQVSSDVVVADGADSAETRYGTVTVRERCGLPPLERKALEYFKTYWDSQGYDWFWNCDEGCGGDLDVAFDVTAISFANGGAWVRVYAESGPDGQLVFDGDGALVQFQTSNLSEVKSLWFCSGTSATAPDAECIGESVAGAPHTDEFLRTDDGTARVGSTSTSTPAAVAHALDQWVAATHASVGTSVSWVFETWSSIRYTDGARVTLSAPGLRTIAYLYARSGFAGETRPFVWLFASTDSDGTRLLCQEIPEP